MYLQREFPAAECGPPGVCRDRPPRRDGDRPQRRGFGDGPPGSGGGYREGREGGRGFGRGASDKVTHPLTNPLTPPFSPPYLA